MTKPGLALRLKMALWGFYSDEFWAAWRSMRPDTDRFLATYNETLDGLIAKLPATSKTIVKEMANLMAMYRIREGAKVLNGTNDKLIDNVRLFEDIHWKEVIERVERKEAEEKKKQEKKLKKLSTPIPSQHNHSLLSSIHEQSREI